MHLREKRVSEEAFMLIVRVRRRGGRYKTEEENVLTEIRQYYYYMVLHSTSSHFTCL